MRKFEIIYDDSTVVRGTSVKQYRDAPNDGIQFVIIQELDGSIQIHKALHEYEYRKVKKPGSLTSKENYESIKRQLPFLSTLMHGN